MTYIVTAIPNGKWRQNCYLVSDKETGLTLIIDPGSDAPLIQGLLSSNAFTPVGILNTHAHYDHIGAVAALMEHYKLPFYLNPADAKLIKQANLYKFLFDSNVSVDIPDPTHELTAQVAVLKLGGFQISVMCTPGHTKGGTCFLIGVDLFSGDTLLHTGPGRTDLPGGDKIELEQSIQLLSKLPGSTTVRPGHGRSFSLGSLWEKIAQTGAPN